MRASFFPHLPDSHQHGNVALNQVVGLGSWGDLGHQSQLRPKVAIHHVGGSVLDRRGSLQERAICSTWRGALPVLASDSPFPPRWAWFTRQHEDDTLDQVVGLGSWGTLTQQIHVLQPLQHPNTSMHPPGLLTWVQEGS